MATAKKLAFAKPAAPPFTAITTNVVTVEQLTAQVQQTMEQNAALLQAYHRLWYESTAHTWGFTGYLGIGLMKCPNDLWMYQDIITRLRPKTILEMGTFAGGSALWFAHLLDLNGLYGSRVITVDIDATHRDPRAAHKAITFYEGSSVDPKLASLLIHDAEHPLLVVLDSDHSEGHVRKELELYAPACQSGDRLVVEDTNVAWPNDRGARGALEDYLAAHPGEWWRDILCERYLLTMHPDGWLVKA